MAQIFNLNIFSDLFALSITFFLLDFHIFQDFPSFCIHIHAAGLQTESVLVLLHRHRAFLLSFLPPRRLHLFIPLSWWQFSFLDFDIFILLFPFPTLSSHGRSRRCMSCCPPAYPGSTPPNAAKLPPQPHRTCRGRIQTVHSLLLFL